ncbi:nuclear transport factor 2 family protein [Streptosporangium longisporum]|uniref:SnoaL-like domain-containing protein n=1 Tax=Streptosporangium longisporum TaxID=46187 RepID=A0ABP6KLN9_9ACTN
MSNPEEIGNALVDAVNNHDLKALMRYYSQNAVFVAPGGVAEGHDQIHSYFEHFLKAFPDLRVTLWAMIEDKGDRVYEWSLSATHTGPFLAPGGGTLRPTGRTVVTRVCSVHAMENGLVLSSRIYFDQLDLLLQLGTRLDLGDD